MFVRHIAPSLYLIAILCIALIIRLISLDQSFWLDEAAQAVLSRNPFIPGHFNGDFQPPLFYYLAHFWMQWGRAEWFLRLPSVFFAVATALLNAKLGGKRSGAVAAILLATAPFHVYYSQEFRMYSMLTFLTTLGWYFLIKKRPHAYVFITLAAIFTHYFAFINVLLQIIYLLRYHRNFLKSLIVPLELVLIIFAFWLPTLTQQVRTSQALVQAWPTWATVSNTGFFRFPALTLAKFAVGQISPTPKILYGLVVVVFGLICVYSLFRCRQRVFVWMFAGPLFLAWIFGIWIPATAPWRVQFVLPALYLIIASSATRSRLGTVIIIYMLIQNLFFTGSYLFNPHNHREDWRSAVTYTDSLDGVVVSEFIAPFAPMDWYSKDISQYHGGSAQQKVTLGSVSQVLGPLTFNGQPISVYSYLFEISDPNRYVEQYIVGNGYSLVKEKDFKGVGIVRTYQKF